MNFSDEFQRITFGPKKGGYHHAKFIRGEPELCKEITRVPIKSKAQRGMRKSFTVGTDATSSISAISHSNPNQPWNHLNNLNSISSQMSVSTARIDELFGESVEQSPAALQTNNLGRASFVHHSAGVLAASQLDQRNMKDGMASSSIGSSNLHPIQPIPLHDNAHKSKGHSFQQTVMNSDIQRKLGRTSFVHHVAGVLAASDKVSAISTQENGSSMRNMTLQLKSLHIPVDSLEDEDMLDDLKKIDEMFGKIPMLKAQFERASFLHHANNVLAGSTVQEQLATQTPSHLSSFQSSEHMPQNRSIHSKNNRVAETNHYQSLLRQNFERASFVHHSAGVLAGSDTQKQWEA